MSLITVQKKFKTDDDVLAFIESERWPDGVRCVECESDKISRIERKSVTKNRRTRIYQCLACKTQFSATSGTIMHDTHLPLTLWLAAISLITDARKGMSAKQVQRHLGIGSYKTAWHLCHRIREAMKAGELGKLNGVVEIDETYVGPRQYKFKPVQEKKAAVLGIRQRGGQLRLEHVPDTTKGTLYDAIAVHVGNDVEMICTDEYSSYNFDVTQYEGKHFTVNHGRGQWKKGNVSTNAIESAFSLFKRGIVGNYHRVSVKHLDRYLAEFEYRFNSRKDPELFRKTVKSAMKQKPLPLANLLSQ